MKKEFVPYELALELNQLGYDEFSLAFYERNKELIIQECEITDFYKDSLCYLAPTYSQAFRWFRENYKINHSIIFHETTFSNDYQYLILTNDNEFVEVGFETYEEAELACLKKLIEIVKTK